MSILGGLAGIRDRVPTRLSVIGLHGLNLDVPAPGSAEEASRRSLGERGLGRKLRFYCRS